MPPFDAYFESSCCATFADVAWSQFVSWIETILYCGNFLMYALNAAIRSVTLFWLAVPVRAMTLPLAWPALFIPSTRFIAANLPSAGSSVRASAVTIFAPAADWRPIAPRIGMPAAFARMYDGTIADALAGTEMIRSGLSAIRRFMFCASTAGSKTELSTVTLAPCFSRPLLTVFAHAEQNGFWLVQMITPIRLPSSGPAVRAPRAPVTETAAAAVASVRRSARRVALRVITGGPFGRSCRFAVDV